MSRYIDVDALGIGRANPDVFIRDEYARGWNLAIEIIENAPTADVAEVIRCKDCIYYEPKNSLGTQGICQCEEKEMNYGGEFYPLQNDYCSYGKRLDGECKFYKNKE